MPYGASVDFNFDINVEVIDELGKSDNMQAALLAMAQQLRELIAALAPGDDFPDSIQADVVDGLETAAAAVFSREPIAHLLEFGTGMRETKEGANRGEGPAFAMFRNGIDALGGTLS